MSKAGALAARPVDTEAEKGRVGQARVKRYWAGKAPEWAAEQVEQLQIGDRDVVRTEVAAPVIVRKADPRLARLARTRSEDVEEIRERHREIRAAEIVRRRGSSEDRTDEEERSQSPEDQDDQELTVTDQKADEPQEDEEEALRRRQAVRERLLQQQRAAEQQQQQQQEDEDEEEEEEESEYETESEDDEEYGTRLLKPVFVPKQARETIVEREKLEAEEAALLEYEKKREQERKGETRELLKVTIEAEEAAAKAAAEEAQKGIANPDDIVTDDELDETAEYDAWRLRELARLKRVRDEQERQEKEAQERERLKNMTEEERKAWEAANPKQQQTAQKAKWKFMQKYWHKGAFFQESADDVRGTTDKDDIFNRDYSAPTGEDKFNKELLPKIMQVRNFGRSGRTKWTHLLSEDTTQMEDPLLQGSGKRRAGSGPDEFAKPKKFRT